MNRGAPTEPTPVGLPPFEAGFVEQVRQQMIKFATLQLSDVDAAEDVVQEALAGAMKNAASFAGRSAWKTWVFAILKNKIADELRLRRRNAELVQPAGRGREEDDSDTPFDERGFWQSAEQPQPWANPEQALQSEQFWKVFEACLELLPPRQARAFMMREFLDFDTREICTTLQVTVTNLNVMLHRARLRLRKCLEDGWFSEGS